MHLSEDGFDGETASELAEARVKRLQEQVSQILIFVGHAPSCGGHGANRYQQTMPTVQHDVETDPLERTVRGPPSTPPCPGSQAMPAGAGGARRLLVELRSGRWIFDADWPWPQASSQACQLSSAQGAPELEQPDAWQAAWQARFSESHREAPLSARSSTCQVTKSIQIQILSASRGTSERRSAEREATVCRLSGGSAGTRSWCA